MFKDILFINLFKKKKNCYQIFILKAVLGEIWFDFENFVRIDKWIM